jgi:Icc protein
MWFKHSTHIDSPSLNIVHITDCHLFKDATGEYFKVNTANNFKRALAFIATIDCDAIIFGGDLTQDHTEQSYHLFAQLITQAGLADKTHWLPGNHDEIDVYERVFTEYGINNNKVIENPSWKLLLTNSKGDTPAGWVSQSHLSELMDQINQHSKNTIVVTHHHPLPINGYLDKHILLNGEELLTALATNKQVKALFHGHVHNEYMWPSQQFDVFATPATSIQFEKETQQWQQIDLGPACRMIRLNNDGSFNTQVVWLNNV